MVSFTEDEISRVLGVPRNLPITGDCACGKKAVSRYKGQGDPLCNTCYMRRYTRDRAANGTLRRTSRDYPVLLKEGKPCMDCGGSFPACVLQWDHVPERGPKLFNLGRADASMRRVLDELAKCDLVCANCHAVRTWNRQHPESPVAL